MTTLSAFSVTVPTTTDHCLARGSDRGMLISGLGEKHGRLVLLSRAGICRFAVDVLDGRRAGAAVAHAALQQMQAVRSLNRVIVKFREGSGVRLVGGQLTGGDNPAQFMNGVQVSSPAPAGTVGLDRTVQSVNVN
jgi:hypothetical protein